jgi:UDP-3-O-[3-hydroxymyristoyl] glucosamine N-acyltransferase LpxD
MFTGNTLPFLEFSGQFGLAVLRDCDFSFVGKVSTNLKRRIVSCTTASHIADALNAEGVVGVITSQDLVSLVPESLGLAVSDAPWPSAIELHEHIASLSGFQWNSCESSIHPSVEIMRAAYVADHDVIIGEGTVIHSGAIIYPRTVIGKNCSIGPGTIVGCDAFEVNTSVRPNTIIRQSGGVRLGNSVDVQAKCTLVRATFGGFSEIGDETKFDCQVHFAHDCVAGQRVRIAACAEVSGRVNIGDDTFVGPKASISNGLSIGRRSKITIGSVVTRDVPDDTTVTGNFAVDHRKWLNFMRTFK